MNCESGFGMVAIAIILISSGAASGAADIPAGPYRYAEGFEGQAQVDQWATQGQFKVNYAGPSEDRARSGRRSFKLDITFLEGAHHNYWAGPTLDVPAVKGMRLAGDIYVEKVPQGVSVSLGASYFIPALAISQNSEGRGAVQRLGDVGLSRAGQWVHQEGDIEVIGDSLSRVTVGESTPGVRFEKWGILIDCRAAKPGDRLVLYVDDVSIEGEIPADWARNAELHLTDWRVAFEARQSADAEGYKRELKLLNDELRAVRKQIPDPSVLQRVPQEPWGDHAQALLKELNERADAAEAATSASAPPPPPDTDPEQALHDLWDRMIRPLSSGAENLRRLKGNRDPYLVFVLQRPVTNYRILPDSALIDGVIDDRIEITAAPGEYEPASFVLYPNEETTVEIEAGELRSKDAAIPSSAIDVRVVKPWFQAGHTHYPMDVRVLVPELLLHDDDLVQVDLQAKKNVVRDIDNPKDAATLQPVQIPRRTAKQFWLTVHVPSDAAGGTYEGVLRIRPGNLPPRDVALRVNVLPFALAESDKDLGLYYRAQLVNDQPPCVSSEFKTAAQLEVEFRDMREHGVLYPDIYQPVGLSGDELDAESCTRYLDIKQRAGLPLSPLLMLSIGATEVPDEAAFAQRVRLYERFMQYAQSRGITEVYFYGQDEAGGEQLRRQREVWKAVHAAGGKTWVACSTGFFDLVGDVLDLPVVARNLRADEAERVHALGRKVWVYSWPNSGTTTEIPYSQRQSWGLRLERSLADGIHNYCYQHAEGPGGMAGRAWDDFDSTAYRSMCYTYPTVDGVVSTLQWEAVREGIDDGRYVATLRKRMSAARDSGNAAAIKFADESDAWLAKVPINRDLEQVRQEMIRRILRLDEWVKP